MVVAITPLTFIDITTSPRVFTVMGKVSTAWYEGCMQLWELALPKVPPRLSITVHAHGQDMVTTTEGSMRYLGQLHGYLRLDLGGA